MVAALSTELFWGKQKRKRHPRLPSPMPHARAHRQASSTTLKETLPSRAGSLTRTTGCTISQISAKMALIFLVVLVCSLLTVVAAALGPRDLTVIAPRHVSALSPQELTVIAPGHVWTNDPSLLLTITYRDRSEARIVVSNGLNNTRPSFVAGFHCVSPCEYFLFAIFLTTGASRDGTDGLSLLSRGSATMPEGAQIVWTANRYRPVHANATLRFGSDGGLVLLDADGSRVWAADTSGKPKVGGMTLTDSGNLLLLGLDPRNKMVWQSFDHPVDSLVLGQSLIQGMKLMPAASPNTNNRSADEQLYLTLLSDGLYAFAGTNPPQLYYQNTILIDKTRSRTRLTYALFTNGSLDIFVQPVASAEPNRTMRLISTSSIQFIRFEADGHLRLYEWQDGWQAVQEILNVSDCGYPTVCGDYGICSSSECTCPSEVNNTIAYFRQIDSRRINLGCEPVTAISCQSMRDHKLLAFHNVSYINHLDESAALHQYIDEESCKQACLSNCSCKAALFMYYSNNYFGSCFLPSQLFSLEVIVPEYVRYNSSAYIKVQVTQPPPGLLPTHGVQALSSARRKVGVILGSTGGFIILVVSTVFLICRKRKGNQETDEEGELGELPGMLTRFSLEQLKVATGQFRENIGGGGFGSVYAGQLHEEKIAVKRLDQVGQGKKEFLAEVQTIGSIHHINLVRLVGFCAEKSHRFLVYEYMSKGSLDRWIYHQYDNVPLGWNTRCSIITDIAKGLCYLHEECRQRIAHLDVKPQNILLDENFNAKLSDFGLAKIIDRDISQVVTRFRGTPGYLAPEWLTSQITEKADIYSFGVVVMEVISGRKNLDTSQPQENIHLISLLQEKVKNGQLIDLIDEHSNDMQMHKEEVIKMMKLAMWCLQIDCNKRPQMSIVIKVLEGTMHVETDIEYSFVGTVPLNLGTPGNSGSSAPPLVSHLSGPR